MTTDNNNTNKVLSIFHNKKDETKPFLESGDNVYLFCDNGKFLTFNLHEDLITEEVFQRTLHRIKQQNLLPEGVEISFYLHENDIEQGFLNVLFDFNKETKAWSMVDRPTNPAKDFKTYFNLQK